MPSDYDLAIDGDAASLHDALFTCGHRRPLAVGHEPVLSDLVARLLRAPGRPVEMRKSGFVELRFLAPPGRDLHVELRRVLSPADASAALAMHR